MIRIAVTGGIACGKSLAASILARHGYAVCEADQIAHALYAPGAEAYADVLDIAGGDVLDDQGRIDRRLLGERVFAQPERLQQLNRVLHPRVARHMDVWLQEQQQAGVQQAACVIPLLYEAGMETGWDAVVCIGSQPDLQAARLARRGLAPEAVRARLAAQWPLEDKMKKADYRIWNNDDREAFKAAICALIGQIEEKEGTCKTQ